MTWTRVEVSAALSGLDTSLDFVMDPAVSTSVKYRCASSQEATGLVTKLNAVDYP